MGHWSQLFVELLIASLAVGVVLYHVERQARRLHNRLNAIEDRLVRLQVTQDDGLQEIIDQLERNPRERFHERLS